MDCGIRGLGDWETGGWAARSGNWETGRLVNGLWDQETGRFGDWQMETWGLGICGAGELMDQGTRGLATR